GPHGRAGRLVAEAVAFEQRDLAMARDADDGARDQTRRHVAFDGRTDTAKPPHVETELRRRGPLKDSRRVRGGRHGFLLEYLARTTCDRRYSTIACSTRAFTNLR